jgi:hypothetical protein
VPTEEFKQAVGSNPRTSEITRSHSPPRTYGHDEREPVATAGTILAADLGKYKSVACACTDNGTDCSCKGTQSASLRQTATFPASQ